MLAVTATDLPRLMACNGSRLMGGSLPPVESDSTIKDEGNAADWVVKQVCSGAHHSTPDMIGQKAPNGVYITDEMAEYLDEYVALAMCGEIEVDTSHEPMTAPRAWRVNGRADLAKYDCVMKTLTIADLKYGWSIVEPEDNWTLISHALGWMAKNPDKPVMTVTLAIYQPRPYHPAGRVRSVTLPFTDFIELHRQIDETLSNPTDILNTSVHCYRCPALATCPAARKAQMNAIDATEKAFVDNIGNEELSFQLDHLKRAIVVLKQQEKAYSDEAKDRIKQGQIVNNYALDHEMANASWLSGVTPEWIEILTNINVAVNKLPTPAQAKREGVNKEVVASMTERRNKGVKLVRMDANTKAKKIFNPPK